MRVIGGRYRGRRLRTAGGLSIRPTSDRLRETLFNILAPDVEGSSFLDVCAGSGAVGIEALSRGAKEVTAIERSRRACSIIEGNLRSLGIEGSFTLINRDATAALRRLAADGHIYGLIYFDPPYDSELYSEVMTELGSGALLAPEGVLVVEHRAKMVIEDEYGGLRAYRELRQGESALAFYRRAEPEGP